MDDVDINVKDEEIIDKILIEEFRKKNKNNKYYFEKIGLNDYLYNNIKIKAIFDKDGDIKIILDKNNDEYYLDDFIKIFGEIEYDNENFNQYEDNNKKEFLKNQNQEEEIIENNYIDLMNENKENKEHISNISDINNMDEMKGKKENEEEENNENILSKKDELNNICNENNMKKDI